MVLNIFQKYVSGDTEVAGTNCYYNSATVVAKNSMVSYVVTKKNVSIVSIVDQEEQLRQVYIKRNQIIYK